DPHAPGSPSVAIGHVNRCLLAVSEDALDRRPFVQFSQSVAEDCRHEKDVRDTIGVKAIGDELSACQTRHRRSTMSELYSWMKEDLVQTLDIPANTERLAADITPSRGTEKQDHGRHIIR